VRTFFLVPQTASQRRLITWVPLLVRIVPIRFRPRSFRTPELGFRRLSLEALGDRTVPSTFTVQNLADSDPGSLRQAVLDAKANPDADRITFAVTGTITLSSPFGVVLLFLIFVLPSVPDVSTIPKSSQDDGGSDGDWATPSAAPCNHPTFDNSSPIYSPFALLALESEG
jgi:hypothetical protein